MPAFALKQSAPSEGTGLEEIGRELKRSAGLEEAVYRGPLAGSAIELTPGKAVSAQPGSQFLLMVFNGPASNRQWDSKNTVFLQRDETGQLRVAGSADLQLGREMKKPETVLPLRQPFALPARMDVRRTSTPGPGPGPGGSFQIPGFPLAVTPDPDRPALLFNFTEPPQPGPDQTMPLYLLFPLDRPDLFDAALWYQHQLSLQVLGTLHARPGPKAEFQVLGGGPGASNRFVSPAEAAQFLHQNPTGVLSLSFGSDNLFNLALADQDSLNLVRARIQSLQTRLTQLFPPTAPPRQIGTLAVIAAIDTQRQFYAAVAQGWAPLSTVLRARTPAEATLIARALGVKIDAVLLDLDEMKPKNWAALYNQLGAPVPAYFFGSAAIRGTAEGQVQLLTDNVFYARQPVGGLPELLPKLNQLDALVARAKTGLEEGAQRAQQALAFLFAFKQDVVPYLPVLDKAGVKGIDDEILLVETSLKANPPQLVPANYQLSLTIGSVLDARIPPSVKTAVSVPLLQALSALSAPAAGAEERGPEILAPREIIGNRIYALLQGYGFDKGLEVQFFRAGSAQGAPAAWRMVTQAALTKLGFETRLAEVTRDYAAAEKPFSVAIYEAAAPAKEQRGVERIVEIRPVPPAGLEERFKAVVLQYFETLAEANYSASKAAQAETGSPRRSRWESQYAKDSAQLGQSVIALGQAAKSGFPTALSAVSEARRVFDAKVSNYEDLLKVAGLTPRQVWQNLSQVVESAFTAGAEEGVQEILLVSKNEENLAAWSRVAQERGITLVVAPDLREAGNQFELFQILHPADTRFGVVVDLSVAPVRRVLDFLARVNPPEPERGAVPTALLYSAVPAGIDLADLTDRKLVTLVSAGTGESAVPAVPEVVARLSAAAAASAGLEQLPVPAIPEPPAQAPVTQARLVGFVGDAGIALVMPGDVAQGTRYRIIAERSQQVRALMNAGIPAHNLIVLVAGAEEKQVVSALRVPETSIFSAADFGNDWGRLREFAWAQARNSLTTFEQVNDVIVLQTPASARTPAELLAALEEILPPAWQKARPIEQKDLRTILLVYELGV